MKKLVAVFVAVLSTATLAAENEHIQQVILGGHIMELISVRNPETGLFDQGGIVTPKGNRAWKCVDCYAYVNEVVDGKKVLAYYEYKTDSYHFVRPDKNSNGVWIMDVAKKGEALKRFKPIDPKTPMPTTELIRYEVNCKTNQYRVTHRSRWLGYFDRRDMIDSNDRITEWRYPIPDSYAEMYVNEACKKGWR